MFSLAAYAALPTFRLTPLTKNGFDAAVAMDGMMVANFTLVFLALLCFYEQRHWDKAKVGFAASTGALAVLGAIEGHFALATIVGLWSVSTFVEIKAGSGRRRMRPSRVAKSVPNPRIESLFQQAGVNRAVAPVLKRELDRLGVFEQYENRFLDLFSTPVAGTSPKLPRTSVRGY